MVHDVFTLHKSAGEADVNFPFAIRDYQSYIFGDDRLAHRFGTDLAKAFIDRGPALGTPTSSTNTRATRSFKDTVAVAVLSEYVPTASHGLRNHFVAYLNRHLISNNVPPARKLDLYADKSMATVRYDPQTIRTVAHHVDRARLGGRTLVVLADLQLSQAQDEAIEESLRQLGIDNPIIFAYLAAFDDQRTPALSSTLSTIVNPSPKDVDRLVQSASFIMNNVFVHFLLGRDHTEFCRFLRVQDDSFARLLLDYAIGGDCYRDELYEQNFKFTVWEVGTRESI
ncbi:hypothetical protein EK21DRAFT_109528 [Setomelanomma holmii]|uniref:Uncharacterized protein n=1 Tax=Setomelanomma holmii TaxID=210430 RepID=A0A9P4HDT5_9PLEO|nr:hypothetical protein EK21DRAFT_109528 [Setomelanomma holmii]